MALPPDFTQPPEAKCPTFQPSSSIPTTTIPSVLFPLPCLPATTTCSSTLPPTHSPSPSFSLTPDLPDLRFRLALPSSAELLAIAPMGRGKVQLRRIENPANRQTTFSKRKSGLIKKAYEIAVLCDTDVAVIIFSPKGKLYEFSTDCKMRKILDRYEQYSYAEKEVLGSNAQQGDNCGNGTELSKMKHRIECLQKAERQLLGEDLESSNLIELQNMEQKIEDGLRNIRARQNSMLLDSITELQEKGKLLQERNNALEKKITQLEEENRALTQAARKEQQNATGETCSIQDLHINDHVTTLDAGAGDKAIMLQRWNFIRSFLLSVASTAWASISCKK